MPPSGSGSIKRVRTYADDIRQAQGVPAVKSQEDRTKAAANLTPQQAELLKKTMLDAHRIAETTQSADVFDIRHEEQHGDGGATIISDKRIRNWSLINDLPRVLASWWHALVHFAEGGTITTPESTLTPDIAPSVDPKRAKKRLPEPGPGTAPTPRQDTHIADARPAPVIPKQESLEAPAQSMASTPVRAHFDTGTTSYQREAPIVATPAPPPVTHSAPTHMPATPLKEEPSRHAWRRISEPRPNAVAQNDISQAEVEAFRKRLRELAAAKPELTTPASPIPKVPLKVAPPPTRTVPVPAPIETPAVVVQPAVVQPSVPLPSQEVSTSPRASRADTARERLEALRDEHLPSPHALDLNKDEPLLPPRSIPFERPQFENIETTPIRTYRADALTDIKERQMSAPDIATQELLRRGKGGAPIIIPEHHRSRLMPIMAGVVALFVVGALGTGLYSMLKDRTAREPVPTVATIPSFFPVDEQHSFVIPQDRVALLSALNELRLHTTLAAGAFAQYYGTYTDQEGEHIATTAYLFGIIDPRISGAFSRSLGPSIMIGSHGEEQSAYMVLTTDQFDTAFAGMLAWEKTLSIDLAPFFGGPVRESYDPNIRTADHTREARFTDELYQNLDVRVLVDEVGAVRIVYAFPDASHIIIANSFETLGAIVERMR